MKNKWYKAHIMERYMTKEEQAEFDRNYQAHKIMSVGREVIDKPKFLSRLRGAVSKHD